MNKAQKKPLQLQDSLAVRILICVLFPLIAFAVLLLSQGKSPLVAYQTIITSIFGSAYGFGEVIVRAAYLILTGLAASIPARVGLANAGGEGQMALAAFRSIAASPFFFLKNRTVFIYLHPSTSFGKNLAIFRHISKKPFVILIFGFRSLPLV